MHIVMFFVPFLPPHTVYCSSTVSNASKAKIPNQYMHLFIVSWIEIN